MNRLRRDRRRTELEARYARRSGSGRPAWMSPEVRFSEAELAEFRGRVLADLPEICRRAYVMIREEHATYERVAEELALSRSSIWNHVFAAEQRFRRALEALGISVAPSGTVAEGCMTIGLALSPRLMIAAASTFVAALGVARRTGPMHWADALARHLGVAPGERWDVALLAAFRLMVALQPSRRSVELAHWARDRPRRTGRVRAHARTAPRRSQGRGRVSAIQPEQGAVRAGGARGARCAPPPVEPGPRVRGSVVHRGQYRRRGRVWRGQRAPSGATAVGLPWRSVPPMGRCQPGIHEGAESGGVVKAKIADGIERMMCCATIDAGRSVERALRVMDPVLRRVARRLTANLDLREDLLQEARIYLWRMDPTRFDFQSRGGQCGMYRELAARMWRVWRAEVGRSVW